MTKLREILIKILEEVGEEGIPQSEIYRITGYSRSYVTEVLKELESKGIVRRFRVGKRNYIVKLSKYIITPKPQSHLKLGILKASEYIYVPLFRKYLRDYGLNVKIVIYDDALTLTRDLAWGEVDLALSPIYTQVVVYTISKNIKVIAGGSLGGASLVTKNTIRYVNDVNAIATSKVSTMDYLLNILLVNELKGKKIHIKYINNPDEALMLLYRGVVDAVNIWEPYVSILRRKSYRKLIDYSEYIGDYYCCTLAANISLDNNIISIIKKAYSKAIKETQLHIDSLITPYAVITGLPITLIKETVNKYKYIDYVDMGILYKAIDRGVKFLINVPTLLEVLYRT